MRGTFTAGQWEIFRNGLGSAGILQPRRTRRTPISRVSAFSAFSAVKLPLELRTGYWFMNPPQALKECLTAAVYSTRLWTGACDCRFGSTAFYFRDGFL